MGERVHVIVGGIPYGGELVEVDNFPPHFGFVRLLESIGSEMETTPDAATTFFREGSLLTVEWQNDRHPTTGLRQCRPVDPRDVPYD